MKNVLWFTVGLATGFVAAHQLAKTQAGSAAFGQVNSVLDELSRAVSAGYRQRNAELHDES